MNDFYDVMPIGIPKIPYRLPGEEAAQWVDIYNRLYRERILFLFQQLNDDLANQLISIMLYLNAEKNSKDIFIYINSPGGSVTCGIGVYDIMNYITSDIKTICVGTAASMASFILAGGSRGQRIAFPHARMMIHQPEGGNIGQATEVIWECEEVQRIRKQVGHIYSKKTGQSILRISNDMDRDQYMDVKESKEYGLIDHITQRRNDSQAFNIDYLSLL